MNDAPFSVRVNLCRELALRIQLGETLLYSLLRLAKCLDRRDTRLAAFDPQAVQRILLISSTALGDAVLSTAAMAAIRQRYPRARITALIHAPYVELFSRLPELDRAIAYRRGYQGFWPLALSLRRERPDLALILHGNEPQATPLAYLSGARFIFKLPNTSRFRFLLTNAEPVVTWAAFRHGMEQRLCVAALAGAETHGVRMHLPITADARQAVDDFLCQRGVAANVPLIGLQSGASSRSRMWPEVHFTELAAAILARHPTARFVLTGSPAEAAYCDRIAHKIGATALVTAGAIPIEHLPALVHKLTLLVTGDTGTLHVAVAVGTPIVGLFAVSDPRASGPVYDLERHVIIHRPCDKNIGTKSNDPTCIARIGVDEVLAAVETILTREIKNG